MDQYSLPYGLIKQNIGTRRYHDTEFDMYHQYQ